MLAGAAAITALVLVLLWRAIRAKPGGGPSEALWIKGMGLAFSFAVLGVLLSVGLFIGERLQPRPGPEVIRVEAIARQWDWRFRQPGPDGALVETRGRLHIPAGTPVDVVIRSEDVIHAFWVPQLAGKLDALPGRDNLLRIEATAPGLYHGRSAEFSGLGYAGMRFEVLAFDPASPPAFTDLDLGNAP